MDAGAAGRKIFSQGRRDRRRHLSLHEFALHELALNELALNELARNEFALGIDAALANPRPESGDPNPLRPGVRGAVVLPTLTIDPAPVIGRDDEKRLVAVRRELLACLPKELDEPIVLLGR